MTPQERLKLRQFHRMQNSEPENEVYEEGACDGLQDAIEMLDSLEWAGWTFTPPEAPELSEEQEARLEAVNCLDGGCGD